MGRLKSTGWGRRTAISTAMVLALAALWAPAARAAAPTVSAVSVSEVTGSSVKLEGAVNPEGATGETRYRFEYGTGKCSSSPCTKVPTPEGTIPTGTTPVPVSFPLNNLQAGTLYHVRLVARNAGGTTPGPESVFAPYSAAINGLPDKRAYEQASPLDKSGGDAVGQQALVKATPSGGGVTFASSFGLPGEVGAQARSAYLVNRGTQSWSTARGLLPPETFGEGGRLLGWLPDYSWAYDSATKFTEPPVEAMIAQPAPPGSPVQMTAYVPGAEYAYAGATPDGGVVFFEAEAKLPPKPEPPGPGNALIPAAVAGAPNLYAWDRESGEVHLVSVLNDGSSPPLGGIGGPYDWARGDSALSLRQGGGARAYYMQDGHAVRPDGSIYFTAAGTGQLYLRENPTAEQSDLNGSGQCIQPGLACTIHVSASHKTNGGGIDGVDSGGAQPAAFQAASEDGTKVFFTSPEMLTNDANTGPEQPSAAIMRDTPTGVFVPKRAVGLALDSEYIYWADPVDGTIGRAKLDGSEPPDDAFIAPGPVKCKETEPGHFEEAPSKPRYVAVDSAHVYWTNTGCLENGEPEVGGGTIGRAELDGSGDLVPGSVEPEAIPGKAEPSPGVVVFQVSDPQGIAVSASHVYWANAPANAGVASRAIARANIEDGGVLPTAVEPKFWVTDANGERPYGVAVGAGHVYFGVNEEENNQGYVARIELEGGGRKVFFVGKAGVRGVGVNAEHVYWASQGETAIGRCNLELAECTKKLVEVQGVPNGVAADAAHLYWSVNGETEPNPGNDLYRFEPGGATLTDLTPLPGSEEVNGAGVLGVLGASKDGSRVYFAANGDLDGGGPASPGDCHSSSAHGPIANLSGHCNLYLHEEGAGAGTTTFLTRLHAGGGEELSDAFDWAPTPLGIAGGGQYQPRTARLSGEGRALLFRSQDSLTEYQTHGVPEYYLYRSGDGRIRCLTCNPSGEAPGEGPLLSRATFPPGVSPPVEIWAVLSRNLSEDGSHFFFETPEALSPADTNGGPACEVPLSSTHQYPPCEDVYEWEAPGAGSCTQGGPSYSPLNEGCIYLISSGKGKYPSLFGDASESGEDVFFFARESLVGQDEDQLQDVYDARVEGGLPSQNPVHPIPCESAGACHGPEQTPAGEETPGSSSFQGPPDPKPKRKKAKERHHKKGHAHKKHHHRTHAKGGNVR